MISHGQSTNRSRIDATGANTGLTYALVTPSYWKDVEQCRLLVESIQRWVAPTSRHYLLIAKRDVPLFTSMLGPRTKLVVVEEIIPSWLFRLPGLKRFWLSLRTRPVKNWILQQIVKLSAPSVVTEDVLLFADSDMFFIAPYDPRSFERNGKVPLLREVGQRGKIDFNDRWQAVCANLLGLPVETDCDTNYVAQLVFWRRANALAMLARMESINARDWQECIAPLSVFSEYILYGLYSVRVLSEETSGHWHDQLVRTLCYWPEARLDISGLEKFKSQREPHHQSAMISAKSGTSVADIRRVFQEFL
jgi:hypothetical protein